MCDEKQINNYVAAGVRLPPCKQIVTSILQLFPPKLLADRDTHEFEDPNNGTNLIYMLLKGATDLSTSMSVSDSVSGPESNHDLDLGLAANTSVFYPAILQCFAIILLGYLAGKAGITTSKESKGLNTFIGTFSLPALIFLSMAQLNLNQINWKFLLGICLAKTVIFASVITISLIVSKGKKLDQAGLFAIFCTQSNDFALGYPILKSLYGKSYPHSPDYMYLLAPINLILLNPIAFALMEISKQNNVTPQSKGQRQGQDQQIQEDKLENCVESSINRSSTSASRCTIFIRVIRGFLLNPAVIMTVLGIAGNFICKHRIPATLQGIMKDLGSAFSAASLFSLGLTMVGSAGSLKGSGFVVSGILILVKLLVMPLVSREFVSFFQAVEDGNRNETMMLSNFAFLYGTLPTAPGVFVYATQFDMALEMIAGAMVACTFISAPIIFVSAKMVALNLSTEFNLMDYYHSYDLLVFSISLIGLCASLWVLVLFILRKTRKTFPHFVTFCIVISQTVTCIGGIIRSGKSIGIGTTVGLAGDYNDNWRLFPEFGSAVILFSIFSTKIWTGLLAISLIDVKSKRVVRILKLRHYMGLISWGVPACIVTTLVFYVKREDIGDGRETSFIYYFGEAQAVAILVIFTISFAVTIGCLAMYPSCGRRTGSHPAQQTTSTLFHANLALDFNPKEDHHLHCRSFKRHSNLNQTVCQILSETSTLTAVTPVIPSYLHFLIVAWSRYNPRCGDCYGSSKLPATGESNNRIGDLPDDVTYKSYSSTDFNSDCYQTSPSHCKASSSHFILCDSDIRGNKDGGHSISYGVDFCSATKLRSSAHSTQTKETEIFSSDEDDQDDENKIHTGRQIILLVFLCSSTFVGINISLWTRREEEISEIDVQLMFLDAALHFGQGLCTFLLFGFNMKAVLMGFTKLCTKTFYGHELVDWLISCWISKK